MSQLVLLNSLDGTGTEDLTGAVFNFTARGATTMMVQVDIETSVTSVVIEGRMSSAFAWHTVYSTTANDASELPVMPEMRATITNASGLVQVMAFFPTSKAQ